MQPSVSPIPTTKSSPELQTLALDTFPELEQMCPPHISRNKRAVIERMITQWVMESKLEVA